MSTSQLNSVGTEVSTGIYLTLWISLCFIDPSLLGFVAEIMVYNNNNNNNLFTIIIDVER